MSILRRSMLIAAWPQPLAYRAQAEANNASTAAKPAGVAVGDLVVVVTGFDADPTLTTAGGSAWTKDSSATQRLFWKILNATDVANAWNFSTSNIYATSIAYSPDGVAIDSVNVRSSADALSSATSISIPGFAPSAGGRPRAVIAAISGGDDIGGGVVPPAGFTERVESGNPEAAFADAQQTYYFGPAAFTGLAGGSGGGPAYSGWLLEVH